MLCNILAPSRGLISGRLRGVTVKGLGRTQSRICEEAVRAKSDIVGSNDAMGMLCWSCQRDLGMWSTLNENTFRVVLIRAMKLFALTLSIQADSKLSEIQWRTSSKQVVNFHSMTPDKYA